MRLVADRFVVREEERAVDLSSGEEVALRMSTAGGPVEQTRWMLRCDGWSSLFHPAIARLVDFGLLGQTHRFEAWRCGSRWPGSRVEAERAVRHAAAFLRRSALTEGTLAIDAVRTRAGRAVVVPDERAGYEAEAVEPAGDLPLSACGLAIAGRRSVQMLAELFAEPGPPSARVVALWAPRGGGLSTAIEELSRAARLNGYVPLSSALVEGGVIDRLEGRSIFLIDRAGALGAWQKFLDITMRSPNPHVVLLACRQEPSHVPGLPLERLVPSAMAEAIRPRALSLVVRRQVEAAARRSRGLPGRFVSLLWQETTLHSSAGRSALTRPPGRVAEPSPAYGPDGAANPVGVPTPSPRWPAAGDLAALQSQIETAARRLDAGRHALGDRLLRSAIGGLARRRDWGHALSGAMALAGSLLKRGRPHDAQAALGEAKGYATRGGHEEEALEVAILTGVAWMDLARPDAAEIVLQAALGASRSGGRQVQADHARLALARCLFWRGKYEDGAALLSSMEPPHGASAVAVATASSRIAVGRGDLGGAVASATEALAAAERLGDPAILAQAACGAAFAHLAIGDRAAADRDLDRGIRAARAARDPLTALRARLLAAESARRAGRGSMATALLGRIGRLSRSTLPPIVRARCSLLADLLTRAAPAEVVRRHVGATGLEALALFAVEASALSSNSWRTGVEEVVDILRSCQTLEDEGVVLTAVCSRVRHQLKAAAVACFGRDRGVLVLAASEGRVRFDSGIGDRVVAVGQAIAPHLREGVVEGGAPVRYGGETVGALVVRWPFGSLADTARATMLLTVAAVAAGPALAAVLARRTASAVPLGEGELLGVSAAIAEVRQAVERAAAAPFAVLIEGESGSGKELVARALHRRGGRRSRPLCTLNCAALPDDLVEAELFGHARGAFTGAVAERAGVFEEAHTGTLVLDEIGELSLRAQAKLLRTIQEGELRRVGENIARRIDVRIVSATNRDLRARREDIAVLVEHCWREAAGRVGSRAVLSSATVAALARYDWPGNVRELQNVLAALVVRSPRRGVVPPTALPPPFASSAAAAGWRLVEARRGFEERFVRAALVRSGGHRAHAAAELGVTRQGLTKLMTRLGISE